jgi:hypothetical protein
MRAETSYMLPLLEGLVRMVIVAYSLDLVELEISAQVDGKYFQSVVGDFPFLRH